MKVVYEQLHNHLFQGQVIVHHSHTQNHKHKKIQLYVHVHSQK